MIETILGHWFCLTFGVIFGFMLAAILAAGKHADEQMNRLTDLG